MCGCECVFMCSGVCEFSSDVENYLLLKIVIVINTIIFNAFFQRKKIGHFLCWNQPKNFKSGLRYVKIRYKKLYVTYVLVEMN